MVLCSCEDSAVIVNFSTFMIRVKLLSLLKRIAMSLATMMLLSMAVPAMVTGTEKTSMSTPTAW